MLLRNCRIRHALAALAAWIGVAALAVAQDVPYIRNQVAPPPVLMEAEEESESDSDTSEILFQPTPADSSTQPGRRPTTETASRPSSSSASRRPGQRLASVPPMFGDFGAGGPVLSATIPVTNPVGVIKNQTVSSTIIPPGGGRRAKIGDQNKALPQDRVYMFYNHFENANSGTDVNGALKQFPIDRYTFGFEKTFFNGVTSVEIRMPFSNAYNFTADPASPAAFNASGGHPGNLVVIPKLMMLQSPGTIVAGGLGIELPTGADVTGQIQGNAFRYSNDAVHLSPYMAFLHQSTERLYWLGFAQLDIATNSNLVTLTSPRAAAPTSLGNYTEQDFCFLDLAGGYSFYVNPEARWLNLMAAQAEVHYGGAMQAADRLSNAGASLAPLASDIQMVNLTFALTGIVAQNTFVRLGGSAPLRDVPNRFFDSEFQAAVIQRF